MNGLHHVSPFLHRGSSPVLISFLSDTFRSVSFFSCSRDTHDSRRKHASRLSFVLLHGTPGDARARDYRTAADCGSDNDCCSN